MTRLHIDSDIKPVSEFRANAAQMLEQVRSSGRPLVLTQRGKSAAVLLDVREYERLRDELDVLRDIRTAEDQLASGKGVRHDKARRAVLEALRS